MHVVNITSLRQLSAYVTFSQHDPITSFAKETCLTPPTAPSLPCNVDKKFVYIAPSLCLAGFGGSLPAYLRNGKKFWESKMKG